MTEELMKAALSQGLGYALFVFLLVYVLKTTGDREKNYQELLNKLTEKFSLIETVQTDVKEIKAHVFRK